MVRILIVATILLLAGCSPGDGDSLVVVDTQRDRTLRLRLYLPDTREKSPLVIFSHGSGGDYRNYNWLIHAFVDDGYAVATLNHPHDNARDKTNEGVIRVWDRARDLSLLLDAVLTDTRWAPHIDANKIGAIGHSSGGYAVIALAGAVYNPGAMQAYCSSSDRGADCNFADVGETVDYSHASDSYRDTRIKAVIALAPAVGPAIDDSSLESIDIPVHLITTKDDEILEFTRHTGHYASFIPHARLTVFADGGHFIYLQCDVFTRIADWFIRELDLCNDRPNVDRESIHNTIAATAINAMNKHLRRATQISVSARSTD